MFLSELYHCELTILMKKDTFKMINKVDPEKISGIKTDQSMITEEKTLQLLMYNS